MPDTISNTAGKAMFTLMDWLHEEPRGVLDRYAAFNWLLDHEDDDLAGIQTGLLHLLDTRRRFPLANDALSLVNEALDFRTSRA